MGWDHFRSRYFQINILFAGINMKLYAEELFFAFIRTLLLSDLGSGLLATDILKSSLSIA
jgi:hypothetical protein